MSKQPLEEIDSTTITTLVDNISINKELQSVWGLSFYITISYRDIEKSILVDTSGSYSAFFNNLHKCKLDLSDLSALFITHGHRDHCGALFDVLKFLSVSIPVFIPSGSTINAQMIEQAGGDPHIIDEPKHIELGCMSTGVLNNIKEHSLLVNVKKKGLVVIVGCSHPGLKCILEQARRVSGISKIHGVIGGFHISGRRDAESISRYIEEHDIKFLSPCHCTGKIAKEVLKKFLGEKYVANGSGTIITV